MRFSHAVLAALPVFLLGAAPVRGEPPPAPGTAAVWTTREIKFVYQGFTTQYSCDSLQEKVKGYLLKLGARSDLEVRGYGCTQPTAPDPFAGVSIRMSVLQPAAGSAAPSVAAHWKEVDLVGDRDPARAAAECELIDQFGRKVLPLFTTRHIERGSPCEYRNVIPGGTQLKAEVLIADGGAPVASR